MSEGRTTRREGTAFPAEGGGFLAVALGHWEAGKRWIRPGQQSCVVLSRWVLQRPE